MKFSDMPYERIDFDRVLQDIKDLIADFQKATSSSAQFEVHKRFYQLTNHVQTMLEIAMIRHDIDMTDEFYAKEQEYNDEHTPAYTNLCVAYREQLLHSDYRKELEQIIGPVAFENIRLAQQSVHEKLIPLMQEERKLEDGYNKLLATAQIPWNGQILNLSLMTPYLHHKDRSVRKEAWEKYTAFFAQNQDAFDDYYDKLVKTRTQQGILMGHENYLPLGYARMQRNCYGRSDIEQFRKQVKKDWVPFAEKLHEKRRERLGLSSLSYIDEGVYFRDGNPAPVKGPADILAAGQEMYRQLSPETAKFMDFMCENQLFDVLGRKTKKTGGYMTYIPDHKAPFIFANFNGTSGDADVITHECGHAFQGFLAAEDPILEHADITMETAETHSMSMEFFTEPWMELIFGNRAKDYVTMHFLDSCLFIPYGTMVDEFQDICYSNPSLSPADRRSVWRDLERQYKPHLDYTGNDYLASGGFWQKQHHIYDCPLYYIDYCIAQTNALQYKVWMDKDYKGAWDSYLKLCRLSASDFFDGLMKRSGLANPFEDGCLSYVARQLSDKL
ncbi:MAG: M3 family oligoendopeptidase [Lachnospiraceae bacterium]|nr:M3 family oligoendopeptidase [Lachnospiraceae bacterium]